MLDDLLLVMAVRTWLTASKKKNFEETEVFTSMTILPAMTASSPMMFMTRMPLRMTKPGPASDFDESAILDVVVCDSD